EFSLVVGHGPATTSFLRPWPRSHFSITRSLAAGRGGEEILVFGGEAYDGRELTFYSDLYRLDLGKVETDVPLPWEKLYSAVPMIPGPDARSAHQAVPWNNFVYVFGGEWSSRDQKRYRQFSDLWRFDAAGRPGSRWEKIEAQGSAPDPRSGHRMAAAGDYAVLFGGFSEDRKRRATYLDDFYALHLPSHTWRLLPSDRRGPKPGARAGGALFAAAAAATCGVNCESSMKRLTVGMKDVETMHLGAGELKTQVFVYGGTRPTRKGGESLQVMEVRGE
ncbi:KLHDC4, partial [Symbiodinium sp. KB8]